MASRKRRKRDIAVAYCAAVVAFFAGYYVSVWGGAPQTSVDWTTPLLALGFLSLLVGIVLERWWAPFLPLVALPAALSLFALASVDDRYRRAAPASGAPIGVRGWGGFAATALAASVPALALGSLLVAIGRRLESRSRSGRFVRSVSDGKHTG